MIEPLSGSREAINFLVACSNFIVKREYPDISCCRQLLAILDMFEKKLEFESHSLSTSAQVQLTKLAPKKFRSRTHSVVLFGDAAQKNRVKNRVPLNSLQSKEFRFESERGSAGCANISVSANNPDRYRPTERVARLRLVLQEVEKEYESKDKSGYASFPQGQISGMGWVLDVLEDLAAFAKSRGARNIVNVLVSACAEIENELDAREVSRRS